MKTVFLALGLGLLANYIYGKWKDGRVPAASVQDVMPQSAPMFTPVDTLIKNDVMDTHASTAMPKAQVPNTTGPTYPAPANVAVDFGNSVFGLRSGAILSPVQYTGALPAVQSNPTLSTSKGSYSPIAIQPAYIEEKNAYARTMMLRAVNCNLGKGLCN